MYYFAYGMNTNLTSMSSRCPQSQVLGIADLSDFELEFSYHCNVKHHKGARVPGLLWKITESDLDSLDITEGYPDYYVREECDVIHNGSTVKAIVYIMTGSPELTPPSQHYWHLVHTGYKENKIDTDQLYHALNKSYELSTA